MTTALPLPDAAAVAVYDCGAYNGARPDPALLVSEWADRYRMLTERSGPEPGPWRTARTPYLKAIMDDLSPASRVSQVVMMKGAQTGGTECGNNWIGFSIHLAPGPMMAVMPTVDMARRNSKQRITPLIEDSTVLKGLVRSTRAKDASNTIMQKEFPGGLLVLTGANSAKGLRSMSARYLMLDEVDGYPGDIDKEGDPCELAITRTNNFPRRKVFIVSTPVVSGRSRIERFYEDSDRRQYWIPCPHCEEMLVLSIEHLRWPKGQPQKAKYYCEACARPIDNHHKNWFLPRGEWRTRSDSPIHGYHLSSLYSPVGWLSWAQVADKREKAGADPEKLQVFTNTVLGLPYADSQEAPDAERLFERREAYPIGVVPKGGLLLTAGVDVQIRRLEVEIVAWGRNKESWSVDYRVLDGETNQPEVWRELSLLLDEEFRTEHGGQPMVIRRMAVDSGFQTTSVYRWVEKQQRQRVIAVKGVIRVPAIIGVPTAIEPGPYGTRLKYGIRLWPVNTNIAKEELYRWLRQSKPDVERGETWPAGYCHFPEYSKEYFEQLTAEQLITRTVNGRRITTWEPIRDRNEALDCRIYARAAMASLRMESWKPQRLDEMETELAAAPETRPARRSPVSAPVATTPTPKFKPIQSKTDWLE